MFYKNNESEYSDTYRHLWSIAGDNSWLENNIINALISNRFKTVKKIGYIVTSVFDSIENLSETEPTPLKDDKLGLKAVKSLGGNHWNFVYFSLNNQTL